MRLAVEEINNSSLLLPNVTLGYHIWDTCQNQLFLQAAFQLAPGELGCSHNVVGVVGPDSTDMTELTARIFTLYRFPQISYSAKNEIFTNKDLFPLLFRMVPNENHQIVGLVSLIKAFDWKWVSAVGSGTRASQASVQMLIQQASQRGICISYQGVMTADVAISRHQLQRVIENIQKVQTSIVLLLTGANVAEKFFKVVIELKITGKVWIAPETWVLSHSVASMPGIEQTGTVLGLTIKPVQLPQFTHFECHLLSPALLAEILNSSIWHWSFYSYAAVYSLAQALHSLLDCRPEATCQADKKFEPWQLYEKLSMVDFPLQNNTIKFSEQGDLSLGYNVITWAWENGTAGFRTIGSYASNHLAINRTEIIWLAGDGQVPESPCITTCIPGKIKSRQMLDECSCRCDDCQEGTYQNQTDAETCLPCPPETWSPLGSAECFPPRITFLDTTDPNTSALVSVSILGFLLLSGCLLVFATHWQTPVVKAAGGKLALAMLASLLASCASTALFVGKPSQASCRVRQPFFAVSFTFCVSCLLVRSFQILFVFKMASRLPRARHAWVRARGVGCCVGLSTGLQACLCSLWLAFSPPSLQRDLVSPRETFLRCSEGHFLWLGAVLGYLTLLGAACLVCVFWGRNLPKNYSEARLVTLSLLPFLMGWGCFLLLYATTEGKGKQVATLQMFTVQTSIYAILGTFFLPKCYVILCRPQHNTVAHFQTCIQAYTTSTRHPEQ
ncbi:taste receptor type 1 member 1-like [Hemicordylus capensis]|uniref:taste receptor type 1 member 1-like n=1 Tax=Hemicordylus capensis TaxID=884348 RepID=UPI00230401B6|nr:taste receptor type 1 member 1-like [Hemicordylus capensis]